MTDTPAVGTRLWAKPVGVQGVFLREREYAGQRLWVMRGDDGGYYVYPAEAYELSSNKPTHVGRFTGHNKGGTR